MFKNKHHIFLFICLLCSSVARTQDDCSFTLSRAQRLFDAGNIEQIPQLLKPCIESGFTKEEKQQAQKLIILSYLFDKNELEAEKNMFDFLKKYPEYEISASDQAEFVQLFGTYRTLPIVSVGLAGGLNYSQIKLSRIYEQAGAVGSYSAPLPGFQGGLSVRVYMVDKVDINIEALYLQTSYQYFNNKLAGGSTTTLNETQTNISIPLSFIYTPVSFRKIAPFVRAGASVNYMLTSVMGGDREVELAVKSITGPDFSMLESRNPLQLQLIGSVGFTYSLKNSYVLFDVRYCHGLMEQTTSKKAPDAPNADLSPMYLYTENDFRMNNIAVSVGLFYKFYKPRKR